MDYDDEHAQRGSLEEPDLLPERPVQPGLIDQHEVSEHIEIHLITTNETLVILKDPRLIRPTEQQNDDPRAAK